MSSEQIQPFIRGRFRIPSAPIRDRRRGTLWITEAYAPRSN
jgi:hypothetical protein